MAAVTVGYVAAARAPSLTTPSLADAAGDAVDAAALEFLIWAALKTLEQIERSKQASWRKQRKEAAKDEEEASSSQRRRKKRKKKNKLPGTRRTVMARTSMAGFAGFALCLPSWLAGLKCSASWSASTRRTVVQRHLGFRRIPRIFCVKVDLEF